VLFDSNAFGGKVINGYILNNPSGNHFHFFVSGGFEGEHFNIILKLVLIEVVSMVGQLLFKVFVVQLLRSFLQDILNSATHIKRCIIFIHRPSCNYIDIYYNKKWSNTLTICSKPLVQTSLKRRKRRKQTSPKKQNKRMIELE
jgi:hypothetical protein